MFLPLPTPEEMSRWDAAAVAMGLPEAVLMENAAREAFAALREHYGPLRGARVILLAGGGNNGGDASCLARHLRDAGADPLLLATKDLPPEKGAAGLYWHLAHKLGVRCEVLPQDARAAAESLLALSVWPDGEGPDILVDGLLGTGFSGELRPREAALIEALNQLGQNSFVLALDLPSGLNALSGRPQPDALRADLTVSFQAAKPGLVLPQAAPWTGLLEVRPIGMPLLVQAEQPASFRLWRDRPEHDAGGDLNAPYTMHGSYSFLASSRKRLRKQAAHVNFPGPGHKGEAGRVLILGGSPGLSGAPRLAARGALRAGAGLVCVASPQAVMPEIRQSLPEAISLALPPSGQGRDWPDELSLELKALLLRYDAIVVGPGMGRDKGSADFLRSLLAEAGRPRAVLDADAIMALLQDPTLLALLRKDDVLTPHPGEAAALLGWSGEQVQNSRLEALAALAGKAESVWVLKGAGSLVYAPERPITVFPLDVPQLAVGGSGDVLAGLIGQLLARGLAADLAAVLGVHLHLLAGQSLGRRFPCRGNSPEDIAEALPQHLPLLENISELAPQP